MCYPSQPAGASCRLPFSQDTLLKFTFRNYFSLMFNPAILDDRAIIDITGPDARTFLQGLVTNDVMRASETSAVYAALLTPQGKIVYDFLICATNDILRLDCRKDYADDLTSRLNKYRLRAKVTITRNIGCSVVALPAPAKQTFQDPRLAELGHRAIITVADLEQWIQDQKINPTTDASYHSARLKLGVPDSKTDIPPEMYFPLDCNFEELHGVVFDKGCYVGQELTARMKHRATARRRMLPVSAASNLPPAGTVLKVDSLEIGEMRGSLEGVGIGHFRLDRLASTTHLTIDGVDIHIGRPAYPLIISGAESA